MVDILLAHGVRNAAAFLSECGVLLFFFHHVGNRERDVRWWLGCAALLIIVPLYVPDLGTELALHASVQGFAMQAGRMLAYWGAVFGCLFGHKDYDVRDSVYWAGFVTVLYLTVQSLRTVLMTATQLAGIPEEYAGIATYGAVLAEWVMVWVVRRQIRPEEPPGEGWRARWFQLLIALFLQLYVKWSLIVMDSGAATVAYRGSSVIFGLLAALGIAQSLVSLEVNLRMRTERTRLQIERVSLDYEIQNAKRALQTDRDMQRLYHDMKNHLLAIQAMTGSEGEIQAYLKDLLPRFEEYENRVYTGNATVDALISEKIYRAALDGVQFNLQLDLRDLTFMTNVDLITIFGNALDNAIEAVRLVPVVEERYVYIRSSRQADMVMLRFENPYTGQITSQDGRLRTKKRNAEMHGIGLNSIQTAAARYNGSIHTKFEGKGKLPSGEGSELKQRFKAWKEEFPCGIGHWAIRG